MMADAGPQRVGLQRVRAVVRGRVQGVSFRYYTQQQAQDLGLVGYVRNLWDRSVEVVAEGPDANLRRLLAWLHVGPNLAHVTGVEVQWQVATGTFNDFEVRF